MKVSNKAVAFTLVELLLVVLIGAILIALLMGGMNMASEHTKGSRCVANLRALGVGFAAHSLDNNGFFPDYTTPQGAWPLKVGQYTPRRHFFCPSSEKALASRDVESDKAWKDLQYNVSYGYNYRYLSPNFGSNWAIPRDQQAISYMSISTPRSILLADSGRLNTDGISGWGFYVMEPPALQYAMPLPRHRKHANVLWTDGAVTQTLCILTKKDGYKYLTEKDWDWRLPR